MEQKEIQFFPKLIGDLLDIIHNAIIIIDFQKRIIFANNRTSKMFKTSVNKLQGLDITQIFMPDDLNTMVPNILKITREEGEFEGEVMLKRPDGTTFLGLIAATSFRWDNTKEGMAFTVNDISDIKSIEQSLIRSERIAFLGHLIDDISHQMRNPVMVIGGFSRRLNTECNGSAKAQAIIKEVNYLESLLNTINNFIKLPPPNLKRISMNTLIGSIEKRFSGKVLSLGCTWISDYESDIGKKTLLVDQDLILEALESVVLNACESYDRLAAEKKVTCKVTHTDGNTLPYKIQVIDHGAGIPDKILPQVFSHFYSSKTKHIGMGLTFARRIIEEQMGHITIDSSEGTGTTITCHLIQERRRPIRTTRQV